VKKKRATSNKTSSVADSHQLDQIIARLFDEAEQGQVDLCVTLTSKQKPECWVQFKWDMVNFPYPVEEDPLTVFKLQQIEMIPGAMVLDWSPRQHVTVEHGSPPVEPIAEFVKAYFERVLKLGWQDSDFDYQEDLI